MRVHAYLGNGFPEIIYQRALAYEFERTQVHFSQEVQMPLFYHDRKLGARRADFIIEDSVMVELKAVINLEDVHLAQGLNYLVAYDLNKGLLINFGAKSLQVKRLRNPRHHIKPDC
jgi:GxxExxY protein